MGPDLDRLGGQDDRRGLRGLQPPAHLDRVVFHQHPPRRCGHRPTQDRCPIDRGGRRVRRCDPRLRVRYPGEDLGRMRLRRALRLHDGNRRSRGSGGVDSIRSREGFPADHSPKFARHSARSTRIRLMRKSVQATSGATSSRTIPPPRHPMVSGGGSRPRGSPGTVTPTRLTAGPGRFVRTRGSRRNRSAAPTSAGDPDGFKSIPGQVLGFLDDQDHPTAVQPGLNQPIRQPTSRVGPISAQSLRESVGQIGAAETWRDVQFDELPRSAQSPSQARPNERLADARTTGQD